MAAARSLSELLQEQQEPFLVESAFFRARRPGRFGRAGTGTGMGCCPAARRLLGLCNTHGFKKRRSGGGTGIAGGLRSALSRALCGTRAVRRALRWEDLAGGCFSGAGGGCGAREFRRLRQRAVGDSGECDPRAMGFGDGERGRWKDDVQVDSSRQLSPVSVLELRSGGSDDDDSPVHSPWDDEKPSSSGRSSPPSDAFLGPTSPCFNLTDKFFAMEVDEGEENDDETAAAAGSRTGRVSSIEEQISSWERIAGDISRVPSMMELDLQQSAPQWRENRAEVAEIGARIETLIFDDIRSEAVRDLLASSQCTLATPPPTTC